MFRVTKLLVRSLIIKDLWGREKGRGGELFGGKIEDQERERRRIE